MLGTRRTAERVTLLNLVTLFHANLHDDTRHRCADRARIGCCFLAGNGFHRGILVLDGHSTHLPCRTIQANPGTLSNNVTHFTVHFEPDVTLRAALDYRPDSH